MILNVQRINPDQCLVLFTDRVGKYLSKQGAIYNIKDDKLEKVPDGYHDSIDKIIGLTRIITPTKIEKSHKFKAGTKHYTIVYETDESVILYCHESNVWMRFSMEEPKVGRILAAA